MTRLKDWPRQLQTNLEQQRKINCSLRLIFQSVKHSDRIRRVMLICLEVNRLFSFQTKTIEEEEEIEFSFLFANFKTEGLMLQECGKDWIRAWQHLCVFSPDQLYPVKTHPPQIQTFYRTFLPHVHNTSWYITGILECLEMVSWIVATGVIAAFFVQNQCTAVCYMYVWMCACKFGSDTNI